MDYIKILTPIGMLGYGYSDALLYKGLSMGAKAIIVDSGSTDSGPQKLALGETTCPREAYVRDLSTILDACYHHRVKVLIGSAGGDGSNDHVDLFVDIIDEYSKKKDYKLNVIKIYAEIDKSIVRAAMEQGKVSPCGGAVPPLQESDVDETVRIVAQMGMEPFLAAMNDYPDYDIIIAGRAYDPSPYAAFCYSNGFTNIGNIYHMGKVMECGAMCCTPKSKEALATVWQDKFEITPMDPASRCTVDSLASHTLYEKSRPDLLAGPGGVLEVTKATYAETGSVSCTGTGAIFHPSTTYTIKLEGAKQSGYRTVVFGSIRDPILISQLDSFLELVKKYVLSKKEHQGCDLAFHVYGKDPTNNMQDLKKALAQEVSLLVEAKAPTQQLATTVASTARIGLVHGPYPNQKATAGNFAMPLTPLEIPLGPLSEFSIYHLMEVDDPIANFPSSLTVVGTEDPVPRQEDFGYDLIQQTNGHITDHDAQTLKKARESALKRSAPDFVDLPAEEGKVFLHTLARIIRSKNAGPFEVTFDVVFKDKECLEKARVSNMLVPEILGPLYNITAESVLVCMFYEPANAFKFTIPRWSPSGGFGEIDLHASQQHVPLMYVSI
ncbi:hypothetical protein INT44_007701 [Umbelopsis vinacea]|uniref:Uncharacterized protein n=1 Tax=Umbelopsis vinacea TaxID=44442 RepID=A0A8H7PJX2_9FUNG|nr:hypothetical protein INT44_007701 [Umbelopsis vinacea]